MTIWTDSREKPRAIQRILAEFDRQGVNYFVSKLPVGDYMNMDNPRLIVDRKQNLLEVCNNVCQDHERFRAELIRAKEIGIKLVVLVEHGEGIESLSDVYFWHNPRLDMYDWVIQDGHPAKVPKYPKATEGSSLYRSLITMRDKYGVSFAFCNQSETGCVIARLLGG